jgi:uncharacterized repeat protein (TIGR01451 family)
MNINTQRQLLATVILIFAFSLQVSTNAHADDGAIRFSNNAFKQVISKAADGSVQYDYVEPGLVLPKDVILYEIIFENISKQEISNIVINNPIANNSIYRGDSATGDATTITFSVDGKNFAAAKTLTVKDKTSNSRQAKPEDYTAIRWVYNNVLKPGEKGKVTYKTTIK